MSEVYYVYEHTRNDTNQIFYVGKGKVGNGRCNSKHNRNRYWHNIVNKTGFTVRKIAEGLTEELSKLKEIERIQELRELGFKLCNLTDGGDGTSGYKHSEETLVRMRAANSNPSAETRARMSVSALAKPPVTKETKARISIAKSYPSPETRVRLSAAQKGKKKTTETKKKIGKSNSNPSAETRARMSVSALAKPQITEETRVRMSASALAKPKVTYTCPHCSKEGGGNAMKQWHFDNCKKRDKSRVLLIELWATSNSENLTPFSTV